ncbi:MAG: ParB N-terminal domain-containing protein [Deltaproteobacteria bacterium]|nr:ParB N-terminal domain-containing protein [Deltaproteobacteria bacterium]MBW2136110.1 ParB N-terminal domain-containing protein [Deltaproteobacteria bacterium]
MKGIDTSKTPRSSVDLRDIRDTPGPHSMSFDFDLEAMVESIRAIGLINEPYVVRNRDGEVLVVAGYRRIKALKALGWERAPCRDLTGTGLSEFECLLLNFRDNLATRQFNDVEKGMILKRLLKHLGESTVIRDYMPLLGLRPRGTILNKYIALEDVDLRIRQALVRGKISFQMAGALSEMEAATASLVLKWVSELRLSFSYQLQFMEYLRDISSREGLEIGDVLESLAETIQGAKRNNPQKVKRLFDHLRARRYPELCRAEQRFRRAIIELALPEGVRVSHPPYFEGPQFTMEISFRDGMDLKRKIGELYGLEGIDRIGEPW